MAKLIILCGLPGSGKSRYAEEFKTIDDAFYKGNTVIHSSDVIREELFGDPSFQGDNAKVFELMHKRVKADLQAGKTVIYDATNITRKARRGAIKLAHPTNDTIECHVIWADPDECLRRDSLRDRKVGPAVIDKMLRRWQSPWLDEGFDDIRIVLNQEDFDYVQYISQATAALHIPHQNPHHQLDVWEHCIQAEANVARQIVPDHGMITAKCFNLIKTAARWHDIGKPYTKSFHIDKETNEVDHSHAHYYDHHCVGGYLSYGLFLSHRLVLDAEGQDMAFISWIICNHMEPFFNSSYYKTLAPDLKKVIDIMHEADLAAH